MPEETKKPEVEAKPQHLNDTDKMHAYALEQINQFKKINKEERERKLAEAKKHEEELTARRAKHSAPPEDEVPTI